MVLSKLKSAAILIEWNFGKAFEKSVMRNYDFLVFAHKRKIVWCKYQLHSGIGRYCGVENSVYSISIHKKLNPLENFVFLYIGNRQK